VGAFFMPLLYMYANPAMPWYLAPSTLCFYVAFGTSDLLAPTVRPICTEICLDLSLSCSDRCRAWPGGVLKAGCRFQQPPSNTAAIRTLARGCSRGASFYPRRGGRAGRATTENPGGVCVVHTVPPCADMSDGEAGEGGHGGSGPGPRVFWGRNPLSCISRNGGMPAAAYVPRTRRLRSLFSDNPDLPSG
jgi:hypothetical protein